MGRPHDARRVHFEPEPVPDSHSKEIADESGALPTLRDTVRAPRARLRLECVRLQRRFLRRPRLSGHRRLMGNRPRMTHSQSVERRAIGERSWFRQ